MLKSGFDMIDLIFDNIPCYCYQMSDVIVVQR